MNTELSNTVSAAGADAQYDELAKHLLGSKRILAHILKGTVREFQEMNPDDIIPLIEQGPFISTVPAEPGMTNAAAENNGTRITGLNTENSEIHEGMIRFDIIFYVRMKDGISRAVINIEAQKDEPCGYHILNRAVFYTSRLISSQKERDFVKMKYNDIKRVFSIWVCMNTDENSLSHIHLAKDDLLGTGRWKGSLDLFNIVMIGIAENFSENSGPHSLHRLLGTLLSAELPADEKLYILETEFDIPADDRIREDVSEMCNLSQGIFEKGEARGRAIGEAQGRVIGEARGRAIGEAGIILNMFKNGFTAEQIADAADKTVEEVQNIITDITPA